MTKDKALKMALEALEYCWSDSYNTNGYKARELSNNAITTIKEALAQPEPMQVTIKDFVAVVEGKEDWVGKPVYWAQWPSKEQL